MKTNPKNEQKCKLQNRAKLKVHFSFEFSLESQADFQTDKQKMPPKKQIKSWLRHAYQAPIKNPTLANAIEKDKIKSVSLFFCSPNKMSEINQNFRQINKPTNVLSFPLFENETSTKNFKHPDISILGDIVFCPEVIKKQSAQGDKNSHWAHLCVHSMLHLLGYDHQKNTQAMQMESVEIELLRKLGFANPYLKRSIKK